MTYISPEALDIFKYGLAGVGFGLAGPLVTGLGARLYSNKIQREYYQYQKNAYERQLTDWERNVGKPQNKTIAYPELSYPGRIRSMDIGISQSYANDVANLASTERTIGFAVGGGYRSSRSLYGKSAGRSSRYL